MTEHKQHDQNAVHVIKEVSGDLPIPPFSPEQEARIRQIIGEEIAKREALKVHERRYGVSYPPNAEVK